MATDFVAIRQLLGAHDDLSTWFCGTSIRTQKGFLLGDPACDRIVFEPPLFETTVEPKLLEITFTSKVREASLMLSAGDTLVIVLVGHGDDDEGSFVIGNRSEYGRLRKEELEVCVHGAKGNILVINTACYSGRWKSEHWTLLAAARQDQLAPSIGISGSGECRGGFFTNALLAEYADQFKIRPPYPASVDENGQRGQQREHDFDPAKMITPFPSHPKHSLRAIVDWIHQFRDDIGRTYTSADIVFHSCHSEPHTHPFASLASATAPFHRLTCVPPSPVHDNLSTHSIGCHPVIPTPQNVSAETLGKWSESDEMELVVLAADLLHFMPPSIPSEIPTILRCWQIIHGVRCSRKPLSDAARHVLLSELKNRIHHQQRALAIAQRLGWERTVWELGGPSGKQMQVIDALTLRRQAEASGCLVSSLLVEERRPFAKWAGAAAWLARVWEASGRPIISPNEWKMAYEQSSLI
jgi:hypothetical protein